MVAESKLATTDATLTLWLVGCQFCLRELALTPSRALATVFWICLSLACLTKGPIGPLFLAASAALAWWCGWPAMRVWKRLSPRWGLLGLAVATVPWFLTIEVVSHGEFLRFALGRQLVRRVTSGMEEHGGFPGYYLSLSIVAYYPWSALIPAAVWGSVDPAEGESGPWFLAGLGDCSLVLPRVLADAAAALPSACLSRVCPACGLDDRGHCRRGGYLEALAPGSPGARFAGRDRHRGNCRLAGRRRHVAGSNAVATGPSGRCAGCGDLAGDALAASRIDPSGGDLHGGGMGSLRAGRVRVADTRGRALPRFKIGW